MGPTQPPRPLSSPELRANYHPSEHALWVTLTPSTPYLGESLVEALIAQQEAVAADPCVDFMVLRSSLPGIFSLGADLHLLRDALDTGDDAALLRYAIRCARAAHNLTSDSGTNVLSVALVGGAARGSGFELALACHRIVAESTATMGFPEMLLNLFPGTGAYARLSQKVGTRTAEHLITSGRAWSAEALREMGVVDLVVAPGALEAAARAELRRLRARARGYRVFHKSKRCAEPGISLDVLEALATEWVDAVFACTSRERRILDRLIFLAERSVDRLADRSLR